MIARILANSTPQLALKHTSFSFHNNSTNLSGAPCEGVKKLEEKKYRVLKKNQGKNYNFFEII
jgi:hypothetical protein